MNGELVAQARGFTALAADMNDGSKLTGRDCKVMLSHALAYLRDVLGELERAEDAEAVVPCAICGEAAAVACSRCERPVCADCDLSADLPGSVPVCGSCAIAAGIERRAAAFASGLGPPVDRAALPWDCADCGQPTGFRCFANLTHPVDIPICTANASPWLPDGVVCKACAEAGHDAEQRAIEQGIGLPGRPGFGEPLCLATSPQPIPGTDEPWTCTGAEGHGGPVHAALDPDGKPLGEPAAIWLDGTGGPPGSGAWPRVVHWLDDADGNACGQPDSPFGYPGQLIADSDPAEATCPACRKIIAGRPPGVTAADIMPARGSDLPFPPPAGDSEIAAAMNEFAERAVTSAIGRRGDLIDEAEPGEPFDVAAGTDPFSIPANRIGDE